ncbi:MAG TPA: HIT family protein [Dehalococcoidia bacterium]|nr:HIT family protein [Dehalococcoidia bacterium]
MAEGCVFCLIRDGQIPSVKVFEDDRTMAFMDINPGNEGHALAVTKAHAETIFDVDDADLGAVALTAKRLARAVHAALRPDGLNLLQTNGAAAGNTVPHLHIHVLPRWNGDGKLRFWRPEPADPTQLQQVADRIRAAWE